MAEESGWVIELNVSQPSTPKYWNGTGRNPDHMSAIRFSRQIDAERTRDGLYHTIDDAHAKYHRVAEHGWTT